MASLYLKSSSELLYELSDGDLQSLQNTMEEESSKDRDYFINLNTVEMIMNAGATEGLVNALTKAIGESEGIDVEWR